MKSVNTTLKIARKEISDALHNKLFLITLGLLLLLAIVSITLAALQVRATMVEYNNSIEFLKSMGKTELPKPSLNPLAASKGFVNYIGMIGAILAMILGNHTIVKERRSGTLKLLLSRPVYRDSLLNGKLLGNLGLLASISLLAGMITYISMLLIGNVSLTGDEILRMAFFFIMSFLYMTPGISTAYMALLKTRFYSRGRFMQQASHLWTLQQRSPRVLQKLRIDKDTGIYGNKV